MFKKHIIFEAARAEFDKAIYYNQSIDLLN